MCETEGWQLVKLDDFFPTPTGTVTTVPDATSATPLAPPATPQPKSSHLTDDDDDGGW